MNNHEHHQGHRVTNTSEHHEPDAHAHHENAAHGHDDHASAEHSGHDAHAGHSVAMFRQRFFITLLVALPTLAWAPELEHWFGIAPPQFTGARYVPAVLGTFVFAYGGWAFLQGMWRELRARLPGMMTLISLAVTVAFVYSIAVTFGLPGMALWFELSTLVAIMLLGHWIEMRSINQAQGALNELARLLPDMAVRLNGDQVEEVPVSALRDGDLLLIRPGASVPADGIVREGDSSVNESMLTGESALVKKAPGQEVIAGTINGAGSLRVEVTGTGDRTRLAGIMRLVEHAQKSKSRAQVLADKAARLLTAVALSAGAITLGAWLLAGAELSFTIERVVTVLVIACPHALGLAVPLVVAISTTLGARNGLLIRDRRGLEEARNLDVVVFDKTGTLTLGDQRVVGTTVDGITEAEAMTLAAAVEADSEHPVSRALALSALERGLAIPRAENFLALPGRGVKATVQGREIHAGGPALLAELGASVPEPLKQAALQAAERGQSSIYLVENRRALAVFAIADAPRPESREAVQRLQAMGVEVVMLTGDAQAVADAVAAELGIKRVFAQVLPDRKADKIIELQRQGRTVAMVGDGVNDAPALATADVGIAIGAGTNVAVEAGHVVLVRSDPRDVPRIVALSRATYRKMIQNLWWAAGYNIAAIPLAAGALAWAGVILHPALAAVFMSLSTIIVAINAQLLRRTNMGAR
ncbi:MAG: copper-translocating P-type ATPase [Planctomycetes bacterium]|nr:copper-translocating P-type ATPase [Planctomycetota bacterium]